MKTKNPIWRVVLVIFVIVVALFFVTPLLWFVFAPFDSDVALSVSVPENPSLANFQEVLSNELAMRGLLQNSVIIGMGTMVGTSMIAVLAAYGLSRGSIPGREILTYVLILFSSVVTGTASMVPIFRLIFHMGLIDTHLGVIMVMIGGLLPAAIFIMQDFVDSVPRSYEEAAMVSGASPFQVFRDVSFPIMRPGMMVVGIWVLVNAWGAFLIPFILLRDPDLLPAAVTFYTFYETEGGVPLLRLISAYSVLYTLPVILLYLVINWRYGFRFFGGIKQ